jgi:hypothetical protein
MRKMSSFFHYPLICNLHHRCRTSQLMMEMQSTLQMVSSSAWANVSHRSSALHGPHVEVADVEASCFSSQLLVRAVLRSLVTIPARFLRSPPRGHHSVHYIDLINILISRQTAAFLGSLLLQGAVLPFHHIMTWYSALLLAVPMLVVQEDHTQTPGCHSFIPWLFMLYLSMYTSGICHHDLSVIYRHPLVLT